MKEFNEEELTDFVDCLARVQSSLEGIAALIKTHNHEHPLKQEELWGIGEVIDLLSEKIEQAAEEIDSGCFKRKIARVE